MKRFLMFLVIAIAVVSLGLTIYYFSADNEVIYIKSSYIVIQKGEYINNDDLLDFKNRSEYTTLSYGIEQKENEDASKNVLAYKDGYYLAMNGGESKIVITTNNISYSKLVIDVLVCDGSEEYPYIIKTEQDLKRIGKADDEFTAEKSYKLGNNIELTEPWTPIPEFSGTFDGNYFAIKNMTITQDSVNKSQPSGGNEVATSARYSLLNNSAETNVGFISILRGVIQNLFLTDVNIDVTEEYVGAFAGTNYGTIKTSEVTGTSVIKNALSNHSYVGGIAGRNLFTTKKAVIDRCGYEGTITVTGSGQTTGGIVGQNLSGKISESYFRGYVNNGGDNHFGGLVGVNSGSKDATADIYDSYFYLKGLNNSTNIQKIYGIAYDNANTSKDSYNMVTGCYYGGEFEQSQVTPLGAEGAELKSKSNGYLTKEDFATNEKKFITSVSKTTRYWNFNGVWDLPNKASYPILNVYSSVGSTYLIEISEILTDKHITNAQELYDALCDQDVNAEYEITADIKCGKADSGFEWGDAEHPIPSKFNGKLYNTMNTSGEEAVPWVISGLVINNPTNNGYVGIVKTLGSTAVINGVVFDGVTIKGKNASYVGVLAGYNQGANINGVTIANVDVNINGASFGTFFGYSEDYEGHGIKDVVAKFVDATDGYFYYAGGLVGVNYSVITATREIYNHVTNVNFAASFVGGVAGANAGKISYTTAFGVTFNRNHTNAKDTPLFNGDYGVYVGGIVGINEYSGSGSIKRGTINSVYTNLIVKTEAGTKYYLYIGGVAGYNGSSISVAYVTNSTIEITGAKNSYVGGVVGYNYGKISNSVVDNGSSIKTGIADAVGVSKDGNKHLLNIDNCSIVGGIVGFDAKTTSSTYSIYQCASYMNSIQGYYAGGLCGITYGIIERSYCGSSTKTNGGVKITGFFAGGLVGVIAKGLINQCYVFANINNVKTSGTYKNITSVVNMDVSASAGLTVFIIGKDTVVKNCYAVTTFSGAGAASYATTADLDGHYSHGTLKNCAYQNNGSKTSLSGGKKISEANFKGNDNFSSLFKALGGSDGWTDVQGKYPTIEQVNVDFPSDLPVYH